VGDAAAAGGPGTLVLEAWGGPSGKVATDVPLLEPGVGPEETCAAPLSAGACQLISSKDLSVAWLPIAIGQIHFHIDGGDSVSDGSVITVTCMFEGASGAGWFHIRCSRH